MSILRLFLPSVFRNSKKCRYSMFLEFYCVHDLVCYCFYINFFYFYLQYEVILDKCLELFKLDYKCIVSCMMGCTWYFIYMFRA